VPSADRVEYGSDIIYSAIHQFGGLTGRGHKVEIPARPFLGVRDDDWTEIKETVREYIVN
jgi:phage virion morphogenesis protein